MKHSRPSKPSRKQTTNPAVVLQQFYVPKLFCVFFNAVSTGCVLTVGTYSIYFLFDIGLLTIWGFALLDLEHVS
jgi:hypothetical protein